MLLELQKYKQNTANEEKKNPASLSAGTEKENR
jgi:hypothetical protein